MASRASSRSKAPVDKAEAKISKKDLTEKERKEKEKEMRAKQAFMSPGYNGEGVEKLSKALAARTNEHGPTRILPSGASHDASFVRVFGRFFLAGFVPPHSPFLQAVLESYGLLLPLAIVGSRSNG